MFRKFLMTTALALPLAFSGAASAQTVAKPPILSSSWAMTLAGLISAPTIGHDGWQGRRTSTLAAEGMRFTDYYAEASCTAGRANFITGELPIRTGMTTVGQAGSPIGMPAKAPTIATALKAMGYATGQFGKNHLGDLNEFLPTVHGFDEFFGYLYHLDAMEDPAHPELSAGPDATVGPRNMVHRWATDTDDATVMPRWGKVGKQKIEDAGTLYPEAHGDRGRRDPRQAFKFIDKAKARTTSHSSLVEPDPHARRHAPVSEKYEALRNSENGWSIQEAGMAQLDDIVGSVMKKLKDNGRRRQHHRRASPPTTAPRTSPGLTAARHRLPAARAPPRRRFPRAVHPALARQGAGGQGRERHHVRAWTGSRPSWRRPAIRTSPTNSEGQTARRPDLQGASGRLQPDGPDHRQGPVGAP